MQRLIRRSPGIDRAPEPDSYLCGDHLVVLIVDHSDRTLNGLSGVVEAAGWDALLVSEDAFANASELVSWTKGQHPDAVLYDITEPIDEHLKTYSLIADEAGGSRVVALTASPLVLMQLRAVGQRALFGNPPDLDDLIAELTAALVSEGASSS